MICLCVRLMWHVWRNLYSCTENDGNCSGSVGGGSCGSGSSGNSRTQQRRSSFVVIPPMQICPGDLLVYSKVLTQRNSVLGNRSLVVWGGGVDFLARKKQKKFEKENNISKKQYYYNNLVKLLRTIVILFHAGIVWFFCSLSSQYTHRAEKSSVTWKNRRRRWIKKKGVENHDRWKKKIQ